MKEFEKELKDLINKYSIENECDMPDFLLAEMLVNVIKGVSNPIKKCLDWHGCNSICHPTCEHGCNSTCNSTCEQDK